MKTTTTGANILSYIEAQFICNDVVNVSDFLVHYQSQNTLATVKGEKPVEGFVSNV